MKYFYIFFLLFFSFDSFAAYTITQGSRGCVPKPDLSIGLIGNVYLTSQEATEAIKNTDWASTTCGYYGFDYIYTRYPSMKMNYDGSRNYFSLTYNGTAGCDFNECKSIAAQQCESVQTTLDQSSYVFNANSDYDYSCNPAAPEQPIQSNEECENLSNNQCNIRGGVSSRDFTDNGDFTYECDYTCGDGTTGNENGTNANNDDGICDPNDPNDLGDCDRPNDDPNSIDGSYTPDETNDIEYSPDGSNESDGTGTDNLTNVQGDVLINEIVKLKNENSVQTIKNKNAVVDAVKDMDSNSKLDEVITAINNSSGGGSSESTDLSPVTSALNGINDSMTSSSLEKIQRPNNAVVSFWASDYPAGITTVWDKAKASFNSTEYVQFLSTFNPNLSAGTAANMQFCFNIGAMGNFGCHALPVDSSIWSAIRIFILVSAGFLCRRIIFGG